MIVVDTNVLSEALTPLPSPAVMGWLSKHSPTYRVPAVVLAEMWAGMEVLPAGARKKRLALAIAKIEARTLLRDRLLPVTAEVARAFGSVVAMRQRKGRATKPLDGLIAATALVHHAELATRNTDDFAFLGLRLVNPWRE